MNISPEEGMIIPQDGAGSREGEEKVGGEKANKEEDMEEPRRILVLAMDIGNSRKAVHYGVSLARTTGAELFVLHVVHDPFGAEGWNLPFLSVDEAYKTALREAKDDLDGLIRRENEKGVQVTEMVREGKPLETIFQALEENQIDLLIVPNHEEGRFEHFLFGRTTEAIIRKMPCSVLLVKTELGP